MILTSLIPSFCSRFSVSSTYLSQLELPWENSTYLETRKGHFLPRWHPPAVYQSIFFSSLGRLPTSSELCRDPPCRLGCVFFRCTEEDLGIDPYRTLPLAYGHPFPNPRALLPPPNRAAQQLVSELPLHVFEP